MSIFRRNFLPAQSQPWARQVEDRVRFFEGGLRSLDVNNRSKDEQFSAALKRLDAATINAQTSADQAQAASDAAQSIIDRIYVDGTENIDGATLAVSTLNGNRVVDGTLPGGKIQANTVTANQIASNYIYTGSLTANQITTGSLSGDRISGGTITGVTITGGSLNTTVSSGRNVTVSGSSAFFKFNGSSVGEVTADSAGRLLLSGNSGLFLNGGPSGSTHFGSGGLFVGDAATLGTGGALQRTQLIGGGTTGASFTDGGNLVRTSSSQRYKTDIQLLDINLNDLYAVEPKVFKRIEEVEEHGETANVYPGFIAEELAGTSLDKFVFYSKDEEGNSRPEGIHYPELTAALLLAIKDLNTRIEALESR